jgi:hypothetical protein
VVVVANTVGLPVLSALPPERRWAEFHVSKTALESLLRAPVTSFAYPFGHETDVGLDTPAMVRAAGHSCACTGRPGLALRSTDPFLLPRVHVDDIDGDGFEDLLLRTFDATTRGDRSAHPGMRGRR